LSVERGLEARKKAAYTEGLVSIVVNTLLFAGKLIVGLMCNSIAVISDAFHTFSDSLTSLILILSYKVASKPADRDHPFGHGRFELIGELIIGVVLGFIGLELVLKSVERLVERAYFTFMNIVVVVLLVSFIAKVLLATWAYKLGVKHSARAIVGDAWHHAVDAAVSGLLVLALLLGREAWWVDGAFGLCISLVIVGVAGKIIYESSVELMGRAPSPYEVERVVQAVLDSCPEVVGVHNVRFHRYGDHVEVTLHVNLPGNMPLQDAHEVASKIERVIKERLGYLATVHVEPSGEAD